MIQKRFVLSLNVIFAMTMYCCRIIKRKTGQYHR